MLYFFLFLILVASTGILFIVFKKRLFGNNNLNFRPIKNLGERYWIQRIKRSPKDPKLYQKLADWYAKNQKTQEAIQALEYVLKLSPEDKAAKDKLIKLKNKPA
ncbi:MAG: hypothetical protein WD712_02365 [Candidatus Spechtbacterales bacterium]